MSNSNGHKLNDTQWWTLCALADVIIPPSEKHKVPGAGDREICKAVIRDVGGRVDQLIEILEEVDAFSRSDSGASLFSLAPDQREIVALAFRSSQARLADRMANWVVQAYYRDDRVLNSLGIEARPPFPQGYDVEQGDWAKLDSVRTREPFYRPVEST